MLPGRLVPPKLYLFACERFDLCAAKKDRAPELELLSVKVYGVMLSLSLSLCVCVCVCVRARVCDEYLREGETGFPGERSLLMLTLIRGQFNPLSTPIPSPPKKILLPTKINNRHRKII